MVATLYFGRNRRTINSCVFDYFYTIGIVGQVFRMCQDILLQIQLSFFPLIECQNTANNASFR